MRKASGDDVDALARTLTRAFHDDPLDDVALPAARGAPAQAPDFFRALLRASLPFGEVYTTGDAQCAAIWNPPGTFPMGWYKDAKLGLHDDAPHRVAHHRVCPRDSRYFASHHPKERHWYLQMLGTDPRRQGKGAGSAILAPVLERCDREGERIYLESSKERNIPFYARHGFEVTEAIHVPGGPVVWAMWRDPR